MFVVNSELRASAVVLASLSVVTAVLLFRADAFASIAEILSERYEETLAWVFLLSGVLQGVGALLPLRWMRQYGLIFSAIAWFSLCGTLLDSWLIWSVAVGLVGLATFCALVKDVRGKPREKCISC